MKNIYGQTRAIDLLMKASDEERRHHAWIFSGPRGVGKCTIAIQFAEHLLRSGDGVGTSHQDLHIIRKEDVVWSTNPSLQRRKQTNIPLDLLRDLELESWWAANALNFIFILGLMILSMWPQYRQVA